MIGSVKVICLLVATVSYAAVLPVSNKPKNVEPINDTSTPIPTEIVKSTPVQDITVSTTTSAPTASVSESSSAAPETTPSPAAVSLNTTTTITEVSVTATTAQTVSTTATSGSSTAETGSSGIKENKEKKVISNDVAAKDTKKALSENKEHSTLVVKKPLKSHPEWQPFEFGPYGEDDDNDDDSDFDEDDDDE